MKKLSILTTVFLFAACAREFRQLLAPEAGALVLDRDVAVRGATVLRALGNTQGLPVTIRLGALSAEWLPAEDGTPSGVLPADAPLGLQPVTMAVPGGPETRQTVLVLAGPPVLSSVRTENGEAEGVGGDRLVLEGTGFDERSTANNVVRVGDQDTPVVSVSATRITIQLPADAHADADPTGTLGGTIALTVEPKSLPEQRSTPAPFALIGEPTVLAVSPPKPVGGEVVAVFSQHQQRNYSAATAAMASLWTWTERCCPKLSFNL